MKLRVLFVDHHDYIDYIGDEGFFEDIMQSLTDRELSPWWELKNADTGRIELVNFDHAIRIEPINPSRDDEEE